MALVLVKCIHFVSNKREIGGLLVVLLAHPLAQCKEHIVRDTEMTVTNVMKHVTVKRLHLKR